MLNELKIYTDDGVIHTVFCNSNHMLETLEELYDTFEYEEHPYVKKTFIVSHKFV